MVPMRYIFRSKWAALAWAAGICLSAAEFVGDDAKKIDMNAANSADTDAAQNSTLEAELN